MNVIWLAFKMALDVVPANKNINDQINVRNQKFTNL